MLSDELNHASIIDGCRLSRSALSVYRHRDMGHLAELLAGEDPAGVDPTAAATASAAASTARMARRRRSS